MAFHWFKGDKLDRSSKIQALVIKEILNSGVPNEKREESMEWELKHVSSCIQIARMIAEKRGLSIEFAEVIAALHDIAVVQTGSYDNHASKGAKIAEEILRKSKDFTEEEIKLVANAVANHSDKHVYSDKEYDELAKDTDTLDCFLYDASIYDSKPVEKRKKYYERAIKLRAEFGLPESKLLKEKLKALE